MLAPAVATLLALGLGLPPSQAPKGQCAVRGDVALPWAGGYAGAAELVWFQGAYTVVWYERPSKDLRFELWVARLGADGRQVPGSMRRLFDDRDVVRALPRIALGDGEIGVVYKRIAPGAGQHPLTYFVRIDGDGRVLGPEVRVSPKGRRGGDHASIAWDARRKAWGLLFESQAPPGGDSRVLFGRLVDDGESLGAPLRLGGPNAYLGDGRTMAAISDGGFVVVWTEPTGVVLAELGADVRRTRVSKEAGVNPTVASDGRTHVVAWRTPSAKGPIAVVRVRDGSPISGTSHTVANGQRYCGNVAARLIDDTVDLVWVEHIEGSPTIARSRLPTSSAKPTAPVWIPSVRKKAGWPRWIEDGPCRGAVTYVHFGVGSESRFLVP